MAAAPSASSFIVDVDDDCALVFVCCWALDNDESLICWWWLKILWWWWQPESEFGGERYSGFPTSKCTILVRKLPKNGTHGGSIENNFSLYLKKNQNNYQLLIEY